MNHTHQPQDSQSPSTKEILLVGTLLLAWFSAVVSAITLNTVKTSWSDAVLTYIKESEAAKVWWDANYQLVQQLYKTPWFVELQRTQIEQAVKNFASGAAAPTQPTQPTTGQAQPTPTQPTASTTLTVDQANKVLANAVYSKNPKADVVIVEYTDIQCPFCKRHHDAKTIETALATFGDKVWHVMKHYPLGFHQYAQKAGEASECAKDQGKFYEYIDGAFAKSPDLTNPVLLSIATTLKLDEAKFKTCLEWWSKAAIVKADMDEGLSLFGVNGTPWNVVLNRKTGKFKEVSWAVPASDIEAAVNAVL